MDDGLKQRLIGAIVLLALAVIFVPVVFDREQLQQVDRTSQIPEAPDIIPVTIPEPQVNRSVESAPPVEELFVPDEEQDRAEPQVGGKPEQPTLNSAGVPEAWTLQVASYRNAERAEEMRELLIKEGYTAYTRLVQAEQGSMTRLFVGPKLDKSKLIQEQEAIEEKYKVSTLVLKFKP
jgi:DedD protein